MAGLIATMDSALRLHHHQPGSLTALEEYLYRRSGGMIGSLSQLIRGAAILAIEDGSEQITRDLLEAVPVDYAARARRHRAARPPRPGQGHGGTRLMRLPVAVPPARHETVASYLARLASLHGLGPGRAVAPGQQPAAGNPPARRYP